MGWNGSGCCARAQTPRWAAPAARRIPPSAWPAQLSWAAQPHSCWRHRPTDARHLLQLLCASHPPEPAPSSLSVLQCLGGGQLPVCCALYITLWPHHNRLQPLTIQCCRYWVLLFSPLLIPLLPVQSLKCVNANKKPHKSALLGAV